ncbi:hypothetical protein BGX33_005702 [Mortierella sp. NVP41]|nr:hypothetical protein BGX33_005702 [Mortierella sp. NVP41]
MHVTKGWTMDFSGPVCQSIDFDNELFLKVSSAVVPIYGHLIRCALDVKKEHMTTLQNPAVTSLRCLQFFILDYTPSLAAFSDLVRSHKGTLTALGFSGHLIARKSLEEQQKLGNCLSSYTLAPGFRLTTLSLVDVCMKHAVFSNILRRSPSLQHLMLSNTRISAYNPTVELFRHPGITTLTATYHQVWYD